ncbi:tRNA lysidine(34) synthetase TilS [Nocardioides caldifontis]|uniref:tRNA lysidine(34) synthetase TilS n=1 Tax=Nocardioides caldifontis TaxID=2588938 RepID=UPI0011E0509C|nr:tRNA lysidine(34) synthetase TilS [Nocardioides caldifontis]
MGPDPAVAAVRLAVRRELEGHEGDVLVACSGGADSLALLAATVFETRRTGRRVVGVTVDHGLQEGSAEHATAVAGLMARLGVDETMTARVRVDAPGIGPEAAARQARYAALGQAAAHLGAPLVLLGHTADDQAETVLLGLTRGSGGRSIAGMRRRYVEGGVAFVRPLLDVTRAQTEQACRAEGIEPWQDPHNHDPRFTRSRLRHRVLPVLEEELGPGVSAALARTADLLQQDVAALDELADELHRAARTADGGLDVASLAAAPVALRTRVLRAAAVGAGCPSSELFRVHVEALASLVPRGRGREVQLPGHVSAAVDGDGTLRFRSTRPGAGDGVAG